MGSAAAQDAGAEPVFEKGPAPVELEQALEAGDVQAPLTELAGSDCPDYNWCYWKQIDYGGQKLEAGTAVAGFFISLEDYDRSGKNRFGNRRVRILDYLGAGIYEVLDCVPAGGNNRNLPLRADSYKIGAQGNNC